MVGVKALVGRGVFVAVGRIGVLVCVAVFVGVPVGGGRVTVCVGNEVVMGDWFSVGVQPMIRIVSRHNQAKCFISSPDSKTV